jgi:excisionase family DNA binding protein
MKVDPVQIIGWPALLTLELACRYLSLERGQFLALARTFDVPPVDVGTADVMWRLRDLNRMVTRLPRKPSMPDGLTALSKLSLDQQSVDRIAAAIVSRLRESDSSCGQARPALLSISDTARELGIGRTTVYKHIEAGTLIVRRIGSRTLVTRESIEALIVGG